ncbi:hypothetical protein M9458_052682, partial [Cirrhinus mrigala]
LVHKSRFRTFGHFAEKPGFVRKICTSTLLCVLTQGSQRCKVFESTTKNVRATAKNAKK